MRHRSKVLHIAARFNHALMIEFLALLDRANISFPYIFMNTNHHAAMTDLPITIAVFASSKNLAWTFQIRNWAFLFIE